MRRSRVENPGEVAEEHLLDDHDGGARRAGDYHLLVVPQEAVVRVGISVHREVRARHHLERRTLQRRSSR